MTPEDPNLVANKPLVIRRGLVASVDIYEIKDSELDALEKGTSADLQLNFAVFLLSISFSAITSLFTAKFDSDSIKIVYIVVAVIGILMGAYLLIAWWSAKSSVRVLCGSIRLRITALEMSREASIPSASDPEIPLPSDERPQG